MSDLLLKKIDLGCGRMKAHEHIGIDLVQCVDQSGKEIVDILMDFSKDPLPFDDSTVDEIKASSVLEHVDDFRFVLNECWRVLKPEGFIHGSVPVCGSVPHWQDPTHKRCFIKQTFGYFTGESLWKPGAPGHPKYADYGFNAWDLVGELFESRGVINFKMKPRK